MRLATAPTIEVRAVPGFEGLYEVSDHGFVYSHPRSWTVNRITISHQGMWMKPHLATGGYRTAALRKDGRRHGFLLHRLVAMAFLPNPENLPEVNHKNGNRADNRVENLEWCSTPANQRHAVAVRRSRGQWITHPSVMRAANDGDAG